MSGQLRILRGTTLVLLGCALLGWLIEQLLLLLLLGALGCLAWQLLHLYQLERWLSDERQRPPRLFDLYWRDIYQHFVMLRRRNRKRKRKLSRTLHNVQQGVRNLPDAIVVLDMPGRVNWFNPAAQRLLGLDPAKDRGLTITSLLRHPDFIAYFERTGERDDVLFSPSHQPELRLRARLLPYTKKQSLLWVGDVSQAHQLEQMRRDFVANASHELRTPLTVINGYLEAMQESPGAERSTWSQPLRSMRQQAERMMGIIRDLLLLSRLESPDEPMQCKPVDVPALLAGIVKDARVLSGERDHGLELQAEQGLWLAGAARDLRSAFANLIFNAVQHTPAGTRVTIRWYRDDAGLHLAVEDRGDGIPAHHLVRLTERFYRVDKSRQRDAGHGTGLGLAIVKHVLQRHGGSLRVSSEVGTGSCFTCDFPPAARVLPAPLRASA